MKQKRMKVRLSPEALRRLLALPDDVRIVSVYAHPDPVVVEVLVEGDSLPETRSWPGAMSDQEMAALGLVEALVLPVDEAGRPVFERPEATT